jgi:hypothetical protein
MTHWKAFRHDQAMLDPIKFCLRVMGNQQPSTQHISEGRHRSCLPHTANLRDMPDMEQVTKMEGMRACILAQKDVR